MEGKKSFFSGIKEKLTIKRIIILAVVIGVVLLAVNVLFKNKTKEHAGFEKAGTRTTVLRKTTLNDSVTVSGTVESTQTVNVACTVTGYTVSEILVQAGDTVTEGDVIARLDTSDLLEDIAKAKEKLADSAQAAQISYDSAKTDMDKAYDNAVVQEKVLAEADTALSIAKANFALAQSAVAAQQTEYETAQAKRSVANNTNNKNIADLNSKKSAMDTAFAAQAAAQTAYDNAVAENAENTAEFYTALETAQAEYTVAQQAYTDAENLVTETTARYNTAKQAEVDALDMLNSAKTATNYTALENEYNRAQQVYSSARTTLDNMEKIYSNAVSAFEKAEDNLKNASTSEELENLYEKYNNCVIKANATGTITQVNATVGSVANGTIAVIQDTENLKISTSFAEYDVQNIDIGMQCIITSDANDKTLSGYVSQISPVASGGNMGSSDVSFGAEITINGNDHGLLIGMNAQAEVVITQVSDIYVVPFDAVGTDENGKKVVYVQDGEEFTPVEVKTGMETDYYIEISSPQLSDGMVIRSSANEDESETVVFTEDGDATQQGGFNMGMLGGMTGGNMPSGAGRPDRGNMPAGGPGDRG